MGHASGWDGSVYEFGGMSLYMKTSNSMVLFLLKLKTISERYTSRGLVQSAG